MAARAARTWGSQDLGEHRRTGTTYRNLQFPLKTYAEYLTFKKKDSKKQNKQKRKQYLFLV